MATREREHDVWRDKKTGRLKKAPRGARALQKLRDAAAGLNIMEDRIGQRLRTREETRGHWYMVKGARRWVRRERRAGWHHGFYYVPEKAWPVVPPRSEWESPRSYSAPPGTTMTSVIPDDVWKYAQRYREERAGYRMSGDSSTRREKLATRAGRAGTGPNAYDYPEPRQGRKAKTVTRTPRGGGYYDKRDRRGRFTR